MKMVELEKLQEWCNSEGPGDCIETSGLTQGQTSDATDLLEHAEKIAVERVKIGHHKKKEIIRHINDAVETLRRNNFTDTANCLVEATNLFWKSQPVEEAVADGYVVTYKNYPQNGLYADSLDGLTLIVHELLESDKEADDVMKEREPWKIRPVRLVFVDGKV